jgi:hypothetical protein
MTGQQIPVVIHQPSGIEKLLQSAPGSEHVEYVGARLAPDVIPLQFSRRQNTYTDDYEHTSQEPDLMMLGHTSVSIKAGLVIRETRMTKESDMLTRNNDAIADRMKTWIGHVGVRPVPGSSMYPAHLLQTVIGELGGDYPLAIVSLEVNKHGARYVSIAANTILGKLSLAAKLLEDVHTPTQTGTPMRAMAKAGLGALESDKCESLIVAAALIRNAGIPLGRLPS